MARGRKPLNSNSVNTWEDIFWKNIPTYINILNNYFSSNGFELIEVGKTIEKNIFKIPKGLNSKEIKQSGAYPVISQSKEFIIGYSNNAGLLVKDNFPLIVFGDHSKTIKFIEEPFIIGADGVKILKPKNDYNEKFFYYFLHGVITDTKDYGRHYSLLRKGYIANVTDIALQKSIVEFLDNLKVNTISENNIFFNQDIENEIFSLQVSQFKQLDVFSELTYQLDLIKQLRQAFLREAMLGCFDFPQQPLTEAIEGNGFETGQQLLAKIKAEIAQLIADKKLKKEKELAPITEDEIPFEIPEHWAWCRLGEIFSVEKGLIGIQKAIEGEFPLVVTGEQRLTHTEFHFEGKAVIVPTVSSTGHGHASLKRIHYQEGKFAVGNILVCIMPLRPEYYNMKFIYNYLDTYKEFFFVEKMKGAANVSLKISSIKETPIPCIPIEIQNKYEKLIEFCDGLEQNIKESQGYNEMLLQQVLREALQGEAIV